MRRGELVGVTWRALNLDGARLEVSQQLVRGRGGVGFGPLKSARSRRTVALDPETVDALRATAMCSWQSGTSPAAATPIGTSSLPMSSAGRSSRSGSLCCLRATARRPGSRPGASILRHTAATLMLTAGVPIHVAAARLGDDPKTVLSTYAHLLPQSDEIAAERVAAALS